MGFNDLLSVVLLTSCLIINVLGGSFLDHESLTQSPHHAASYPGFESPAPHHHNPKRLGGHPHKPIVPPIAQTPSVAPVNLPSVAPIHPPTKTFVKPPSHSPLPTRRLVAVRGVVFCKPCQYTGVETLMGATPLNGAAILLTCNNTKYPLRAKGTTDKNGFFFIMPPKKLSNFGAHKCKVTLLSSQNVTCNMPTNMHYGLEGATLLPTPKPSGSSLPFDLFTVGPFAFEASKKIACPL